MIAARRRVGTPVAAACGAASPRFFLLPNHFHSETESLYSAQSESMRWLAAPDSQESQEADRRRSGCWPIALVRLAEDGARMPAAV